MIFIDTAAWIAFANELDEFHKDANPLMARLIKNHSITLFTSDIVLGEILDLCSYGLQKKLVEKSGLSEENSKDKCRQIREMLDRIIQNSGKVEFLHADEKIIADTKILHFSNPDIRLNFSDWSDISFMRRKGIKKLFTYDSHFVYLFEKDIKGIDGFKVVRTFDDLNLK